MYKKCLLTPGFIYENFIEVVALKKSFVHFQTNLYITSKHHSRISQGRRDKLKPNDAGKWQIICVFISHGDSLNMPVLLRDMSSGLFGVPIVQ